MKSWMKLFSVLCVVSLIFVAACSSNNKAEPRASSASNASEKPINTDDGAANKEKVDVNFWIMWPLDSPEGKIISNLVDKFNGDNPGINVIIQPNSESDKQIAAITAGNGPDIAQNFWPTLSLWAKNGALEPLDGFIAETNFDIDDFLPATIEQMKYKDKIYGLPFAAASSELYYNKDILKEAGFDNPPKTLEELLEMADQLAKVDANGNIERMGFLPDYPWVEHVLWPIMFNASYLNEDQTESLITEANFIKAYQWQADLYKKYDANKIDKFRQGFGQGASDPFVSGKLAMMFNGEWVPTQLKEFDVNYGIVPIPYPADMPEQEGAGIVSGGVFYMSSKSKNKNEAWEFMRYLHSSESMLEFSKEQDYRLMTRLSSLNAVPNDNPLYPVAEMLKSQKAKGFPAIPIVDQFIGTLAESFEPALKGRISVEEAMQNAKVKIDKLLKTMND